ncbi:MAG: ABC transporter permease [Clostridiales bacterium]|nr:ABC transporter permease [Clostridiales bacterium]
MVKRKCKALFAPCLPPALALCLALCAGAFAILTTGGNPLSVYAAMYKGAFGSRYYILTTLTRATPIIICGLGSALCWRTNYMSIGGEGQMIAGGFCCAVVALHAPGPPWAKLILALLSAIAAGGAYSLFSAWLLDKFKMSLAISTLMLNYGAQYLALHFVTNVFQDMSGDIKITQTPQIPAALRLPRFMQDYSLHLGFAFAVLLAVLAWLIMNRSTFGYEARMTGYNKHFCEYGGVNSKKVMYAILAISGVVCALAGANEVLGVQYRFVHNSYVSGSFAWIGLNAALISNFNPIGVLAASVILAGIQTGGSAIARSMDVPLEISSILQGCITLFISARIAIRWKLKKSPLGARAGKEVKPHED